MATTNSAVHMGELQGARSGKFASALGTQLSAGITSLSAVGGNEAVGKAITAFVDAFRTANPQASRLLSANALLSVHVSATTSLLTATFQIIPAA